MNRTELINKLSRRVLEISYKHKASHLSSCLNMVPILVDVYSQVTDEVVILDNGHAFLAQAVSLEHFYGLDAESLFTKHGTHPNRDIKNNIFASTGSLGNGIGISLGVALSNPSKKVFCTISDGSMAEGSYWEAVKYINEKEVTNLELYYCLNDFSAYQSAKFNKNLLDDLDKPFVHVYKIDKIGIDFLEGLAGHYHVIQNEEEYALALARYQ